MNECIFTQISVHQKMQDSTYLKKNNPHDPVENTHRGHECLQKTTRLAHVMRI